MAKFIISLAASKPYTDLTGVLERNEALGHCLLDMVGNGLLCKTY